MENKLEIFKKAQEEKEILFEQEMTEGWENVGSDFSDTSDSSSHDTDRGSSRKRKRSLSPQLPPSYMLKKQFQEPSAFEAISFPHPHQI